MSDRFVTSSFQWFVGWVSFRSAKDHGFSCVSGILRPDIPRSFLRTLAIDDPAMVAFVVSFI